jgi:nicotinate phosphoribosyltransferase
MKSYSAIDNDLYKFTMQQAVLHNYPDAWVKFKYQCRNPKELSNVDIGAMNAKVIDKIGNFCKTRFQSSELHYLYNIPFLTPDYIDFLEDFTFKRRYISIKNTKHGLELEIEGPWVQTILFEVPLLSIISETFAEMRVGGMGMAMVNGLKSLEAETAFINYKFADFGTRRRFSKDYQELVIQRLLKLAPDNLIGTSNVEMAKKFNMKYIGTMAHEWLQAHQALTRVVDSQKVALEVWAKEYRGDLGIALSDVVGFDAFLNDFDKYFAKLFDGCRHDSGDPLVWGDKLISHYESLEIDPTSRTAVFSDGLTFEKANEIQNYFEGRIRTSFGIGTFLTNNCGFTPLQIVIKMIECNKKPVAKISDSPGKGMCEDPSYLKYLMGTFNLG